MLNEVMIANKNYASVVVKDPKRLDKTALNVIRYDCPSFLLPIRLVRIDNEIQLRYEIFGGIRLAYMSLQMKKQELNQLLYQLLTPYTDCADWFLDFHNIYLDRNYIMVDQNDLRVRYVYMPYGSNMQTEEQIMRFFCDLVMDVELQDDQAYIATLLRSIMGKDASLTVFADLIRTNIKDKELAQVSAEMPKQAPVQVKHQSVTPTPLDIAAEKSIPQSAGEPEKEFGVNDLAGAIGAGLFGESGGSTDKKAKKKANKKADKKADKKEKPPKESKGLFGMLRGNEKKPKKGAAESNEADNSDKTDVSNVAGNVRRQNQAEMQQGFVMDDFKTEIFDEEEPASGMLRLRLENAQISNIPSTIDLDMRNGYAVIGRYDKTGKLSADFNFDMSLTFIGRRHARFEMSGSDMYIIDLESKNHTYLNNEELLPNRRYLLHKGDRIMITKKYGIIYQVC